MANRNRRQTQRLVSNNDVIPIIIDNINKKFGDSKLRLSSDENGSFYLKKKNTKWLMKSEYRSPCYTTNWCDIPKIKV